VEHRAVGVLHTDVCIVCTTTALGPVDADDAPGVILAIRGEVHERTHLDEPIVSATRVHDRTPLGTGDHRYRLIDLIDAFTADARLMPHLHLSLQAGDDLILKRMKRRHARQDAIAFCAAMRRLRPDLVFGADLIAGFPTETEEMFARSLDLVEECGLTHLHVFPFSARAGTPAARMPQLPRAVVKERAGRLRERGALALRRHLDAEVGAQRRVLAEYGERGRTEQFTPVKFAKPAAPGALLEATIAAHDGKQLLAA